MARERPDFARVAATKSASAARKVPLWFPIAGVVLIGWSIYLIHDMRELQKDPRVREKFKLDDPNSPTLNKAVKNTWNKVLGSDNSEDGAQ